MEKIKKYLKKIFEKRIFFDCEASKITSFKTGGKISILLFPENKGDIESLYHIQNQYNIPVKFLGHGSNVLISDKGYNGIIALTEKFSDISFENRNVYVQSGVKINTFLKFLINNNLKNGEFMSGIPGSIGGVVIMNAGTKDRFISSIISRVDIFDRKGNWIEKNISQIKTEYRTSSLKEDAFFIYSVLFNLEPGNSVEIKLKMKEMMNYRINTQPLGYPSAGSVFKNPEGFSAGKLIEDAGLKGTKIGDAKISEKHANFIINTGKATSSDIYSLIQIVKEKIFQKYGIILETEIELIGFGNNK
jgi:UDP-N-acetylmuramate dehydrogenase